MLKFWIVYLFGHYWPWTEQKPGEQWDRWLIRRSSNIPCFFSFRPSEWKAKETSVLPRNGTDGSDSKNPDWRSQSNSNHIYLCDTRGTHQTHVQGMLVISWKGIGSVKVLQVNVPGAGHGVNLTCSSVALGTKAGEVVFLMKKQFDLKVQANLLGIFWK